MIGLKVRSTRQHRPDQTRCILSICCYIQLYAHKRYFFPEEVTLNLKNIMSPSCMTYVFPSCRYFPAACIINVQQAYESRIHAVSSRHDVNQAQGFVASAGFEAQSCYAVWCIETENLLTLTADSEPSSFSSSNFMTCTDMAAPAEFSCGSRWHTAWGVHCGRHPDPASPHPALCP